jgi:CheY-like chemotaxis protein
MTNPKKLRPLRFKIFHFEDDSSSAAIYKKEFLAQGLNYRHFKYPPRNFLQFIRKEKPDFIIMDTSMPKMDGFAAAKLLRENEDTKLIPILGLSDIDKEVGVRWAKNLFMDDYWAHSEHQPFEVIQKVLSILQPQPIDLGAKSIYKKRSWWIWILSHKKVLYYLLASLLIVTGPLALALYYYLPDRSDDYSKLFPQLTVSVKSVSFSWWYQYENIIKIF